VDRSTTPGVGERRQFRPTHPSNESIYFTRTARPANGVSRRESLDLLIERGNPDVRVASRSRTRERRSPSSSRFTSVIYSPLQMAADLPENYVGKPASSSFAMWRSIGEQAKTIDGRIENYVIVARKAKNSDDWSWRHHRRRGADLQRAPQFPRGRQEIHGRRSTRLGRARTGRPTRCPVSISKRDSGLEHEPEPSARAGWRQAIRFTPAK